MEALLNNNKKFVILIQDYQIVNLYHFTACLLWEDRHSKFASREAKVSRRMSSLAEQSADTSSLERILSSMDVSPDTFLQPSASLQTASLVAAKRILDPVVSQYSVFRELALKGLDVEQVWEQIRLVGEQVESLLERQEDLKRVGKPRTTNGVSNQVNSDEEDSLGEDGADLENGIAEVEEEGDSIAGEGTQEDEQDSDDDREESMKDDEFPTNPELDEESEEEADSTTTSTQKPFKKDVHGLNDEFFSIDDFNRLSEQQDIQRSDEENFDEIDYFAGLSHFRLYSQ